MSLIDSIMSPKKIIFDAVKQKCEGTGITKLVLYFSVKEDKYNLMMAKEDNSSFTIDIDKKDVSLIRKVLVGKIERKYREYNDRELKAIIVQMNLKTDKIDIFTEDIFDNVHIFDYSL
jgi:hypothetical protein